MKKSILMMLLLLVSIASFAQFLHHLFLEVGRLCYHGLKLCLRHRQMELVTGFDVGHFLEHGHQLREVEELKGKKRNAEIVLPRQIVMYLCRNMTDTPLKSIGALLGGKDHASISHGVRKIENDLKTDEALNNTVNIIKKKINPV